MIISDVHQQPNDDYHPSYYLAKQFMADWKPDEIMILGDWFDFYYISRFGEMDLAFDREDALEIDYARARTEVGHMQEIAAKIRFREGNHERRLRKAQERYPEFKTALDLPQHLPGDVSYTQESYDPINIGELSLTHGWYCNQYHAAKHLREYGGNIVYGHVHHFQSDLKLVKASHETIGAWSNACLTDLEPDWVRGRPTRHNNGFTNVYLNRDGTFNLYQVAIINNQFIWEGKKYGNT